MQLGFLGPPGQGSEAPLSDTAPPGLPKAPGWEPPGKLGDPRELHLAYDDGSIHGGPTAAATGDESPQVPGADRGGAVLGLTS